VTTPASPSPRSPQEATDARIPGDHTSVAFVRVVLSDLDSTLSVDLKLADGPHTYLFE
jgi:anthranilate synthase component 1